MKYGLKLCLVYVIIRIGGMSGWSLTLLPIVIISPINERLINVTHQEQKSPTILHDAREPSMEALKWATTKDAMRVAAEIEVKKSGNDRKLRNLGQFGTCEANLAIFTRLDDANFLLNNTLYLRHIHKATFHIDIITIELMNITITIHSLNVGGE
jgi:hypothetical protein